MALKPNLIPDLELFWESSSNNRLACAVLEPQPPTLSSNSFGKVDCAICLGREHAKTVV